MNRRLQLHGTGIGLASEIAARASEKVSSATDPQPNLNRLSLADYQPTSMLATRQSRVEQARYPVTDIHTHITESRRSINGVGLAAERNFHATADELLPVMDRRNIRSMVNLTGGFGSGLTETIAKYDRAYSGRFYTFTEHCSSRFLEPGYPVIQARQSSRRTAAGRAGSRSSRLSGFTCVRARPLGSW